MVIGKLNPKSNQRCVVYDIYDTSPTIQAAAGTGGGQMPYIMEIKEMNKEDLILIGGMQEHQTIKTNGVCTCLTSSMGTGGDIYQ